MAKTGAIKAGRAYVEVFADKSPLVRGLRSISADLTAWGKSIQAVGLKIFGAGAAASAALFGATKYFSSFGDNLAKMSKRTGVSVEALSELNFAASQSGTNIETVETAFKKMAKGMYDASQGTKTAKDAFAALGLSVKDLESLSPEEQFKLIAEQLSKIEDPTKKAGIALSLFGRSGTALLPMLEQGAAGIEKMQAEARRLGLTLSSEDAASAELLNDALDKMWRTIKMGYAQIGAALAPAITDLAERIATVIGSISNWIKEHRGLVKAIAYASVALVAGGVALMAFGAAVSFIGTLVGKLAFGLKLIGSVIGAVLSPVGLVIAAVAGLAAVILYYTGAGGKALSWLKDRFSELFGEMKEAFSGIGAALASGDIGLAAQILWATLKMEFLKGKQAVLGIWLGMKGKILESWLTMGAVMVEAWAASTYVIKSIWIEAVAFLKKTWANFSNWWEKTTNKIADKIVNAYIVWKAMTDETFDPYKARANVEEHRKKRDDQGAADSKKDKAEIEANRQAAREAAGKEYADLVIPTIKGMLDELANVDEESAAKLKEAAEELQKAQQEWRAKINEAKSASPGTNPNIPKPPSIPDFDTMTKKYSQVGTFSGLAAQGLGGGIMDKIARATEETAINTRVLKNQSVPTFRA